MPRGQCFLCGEYGQLERHHIFGGALRDKSERYGLTVDLCPWCHREGPDADHRSAETRILLHKYGEAMALRKTGWTVQDWIREFGKNELDEDEIQALHETAEDNSSFCILEDAVLLPF